MRIKICGQILADEESRTNIRGRKIDRQFIIAQLNIPARAGPGWLPLPVSSMIAYPGPDTIIQILPDRKTTSAYSLNTMKPLQRIRNWSAVLQCDRSRNMCFVLCTRAVFTDEFSFERDGPKHTLVRRFQILAPFAPPRLRHCPWEACDAPDRPMVPLTSLSLAGPWCL